MSANEAPVAHHLRRVMLISGLSGAGKSSALKALEDLGFEAIDNLPLYLLRRLLWPGEEPVALPDQPLAIGIDSRTRDFRAEGLLAQIDESSGRDDLTLSLLFLDCDDNILRRRFTETRRRHPLAADRPVSDGIELERQLVAPLRDRADLVVDTSRLTPGELRQFLDARFAPDRTPGLMVALTSFAYRQGLPREADLVFDVRFLANPHYQEALRPGTGRDPEVAAFIAADDAFAPFMARLGEMIGDLLPRYQREGKSYLTVAIGCTGGQHRSVFVAESLAEHLRRGGWPVALRHRELDRVE
jgi:UPF0042 nucleotide-binding protein